MLRRCRGFFAAVIAALLVTPLALPAPAAAQGVGAYLDGAEPWTESDCTGDVPIVVGADAKAQSDIYSAVTLAGVVGTDCVILAGHRDGDMTADQRARLEAAAAGGYVLGGTAAVPPSKIAGRDMTRLGGADRWATAQQVGSQARALAGATPAQEPEPAAAPSEGFTSVSAGVTHSCGVRADGTVTCWGYNDDGQADAPSGGFIAVSAGALHSCGVRADGSVTCWGADVLQIPV